MKKNVTKFISAMVVTFMIVLTVVPSFAASYQTIFLAANQYWTKGYGENHDVNYSRCGARCHSVSPYSGTDNYHVIQCKVEDTYGETISTENYYRLNESATDYKKITIKEGKLNSSSVYFRFRGNSDAQAMAVVSYVGTITG